MAELDERRLGDHWKCSRSGVATGVVMGWREQVERKGLNKVHGSYAGSLEETVSFENNWIELELEFT